MQIKTAYFSPAELKNLYITTSRNQHRMYRSVIQQTVALVANRPNGNWLHIQLRLTVYTHYGHMYMRWHSGVYTSVYDTSTITQIAIVFNNPIQSASFETDKFIGLYQLTITLKHFKSGQYDHLSIKTILKSP